MSKLTHIKTSNFGHACCDFWQGENDAIYMTREQIGRALEYADPKDAIAKIHSRNIDRLDKFSGVVKLSTPTGGTQDTYVYTSKGVMEICRYSRQAKADAFMDWVWDVIEGIRTGKLRLENNMVGEYLSMSEEDRAIAYFQSVKQKKLLEQENEQLHMDNAISKQMIGELQPKASYYDTILQSTSLVSISQISKDYGMSGKALNALLHELGVQYKLGDTWLLYQKHATMGYTQSKTHAIDVNRSRMHTYWTQKGRLFLYDLLKTKKGILPLIEMAEGA